METEDHLRKAAESGKAKYNYLKQASNSEIKMFFKLKISLYFIASTKIILQFLNYALSLSSNTTKLILHS